MFKKLFTAWKARLARQGRTKNPPPSLEEIQEKLKQTADTLDDVIKQQAVWQAKMNKERARDKKILRGISQTSGGVTNKIGKVTEQFFVSTVVNAMPFIIRGIAFDKILVNKHFFGDQREMECDIVLVNEQYLAIIEVKHFLEPSYVIEFNRKLQEVLPKVLPDQYRYLRLVPAMACMGLSEQAKQKAREFGLALLRPHGQQSRVEDDHLRVRLLMN